ncbi:hypothetical protein R1flu_026123 [Riccia fluitans]|uniref:Uncharacterized protein n=1 Tax=Riccia fluitans TaxID=41844 RepID=A0ABD1XF26_9MARC
MKDQVFYREESALDVGMIPGPLWRTFGVYGEHFSAWTPSTKRTDSPSNSVSNGARAGKADCGNALQDRTNQNRPRDPIPRAVQVYYPPVYYASSEKSTLKLEKGKREKSSSKNNQEKKCSWSRGRCGTTKIRVGGGSASLGRGFLGSSRHRGGTLREGNEVLDSVRLEGRTCLVIVENFVFTLCTWILLSCL